MKKSKKKTADESGTAAPAQRPTPESEAEPTSRRAEVPVLLITLLGVMLYWGSMYVVEYGGRANARVHAPYESIEQIEGLQPKGEFELMMARGQGVYDLSCSPCHQKDGNGNASLNAPPLTESEWVTPVDPSRLIRIVLHGLSGPIEVNGKMWGAGQMLAWKDVLDDQKIADSLTYVRNSWGNKAPMVTPEKVAAVREETADFTGTMTVVELEKVQLEQ